MKQMEDTDVGLIRGLSLFEEAKKSLTDPWCKRGHSLSNESFTALKNHNTDLQKIQDLCDKMVANCCLQDMREFQLLTYTPVDMADREHSFSTYHYY